MNGEICECEDCDQFSVFVAIEAEKVGKKDFAIFLEERRPNTKKGIKEERDRYLATLLRKGGIH